MADPRSSRRRSDRKLEEPPDRSEFASGDRVTIGYQLCPPEGMDRGPAARRRLSLREADAPAGVACRTKRPGPYTRIRISTTRAPIRRSFCMADRLSSRGGDKHSAILCGIQGLRLIRNAMSTLCSGVFKVWLPPWWVNVTLLSTEPEAGSTHSALYLAPGKFNARVSL